MRSRLLACAVVLSCWASSAQAQAIRTYLYQPHWIVVAPTESATDKIDETIQYLDTAGQAVYVQLMPGVHPYIYVRAPFVGGGCLHIIGVGDGVVVQGIAAAVGTCVHVYRLTISNPNGANLHAIDSWVVGHEGLTLGPAGGDHLRAEQDGKITMTAPYMVSGGASAHAHAIFGGKVFIGSISVTVTQPVTFMAYVWGAAMGMIHTQGQWIGAAVLSPAKALIHYNSSLFSPTAPLPGQGVVILTAESSVVTQTPEPREFE